MYQNFIKPFFDFMAALMLLILVAPIMLMVILTLEISNNGSPFFLQKRPGRKESIFTIIKFKTMNDRRDERGNLLPDADRITALGKFVRATSLDELPQLLNVIKGDMSFVGPRPLLPQYLPLYNEFQRKRHDVKPGITGWAQVNGRNAISWEQKFEYDVWYVQHQNFLLDFKILLRTVKKIIQKEGISQEGHVTTEPFK